MCDPFTAIALASLVSSGVAVHNGQQQVKAQKEAAGQATDNANKQATAAEQAANKANAKSPNVAALDSANGAAGGGGAGSTMLTGPTGIDPSSLTLGKQTLLGS